MRGQIEVEKGSDEEVVKKLALKEDRIIKWAKNKDIKKTTKSKKEEVVKEKSGSEQKSSIQTAKFPKTPEPKRFTMVRTSDSTGISGTGRILVGILWHHGFVTVMWR